MKNFFNWIIDNFEKIYIIFLFLISYLFVVYIFPGEGKFRYEFQKGQPWLHENLIAPFDFAIFKMENEIADEKEEILQTFKPYFNEDLQVGIKQIEDFQSDFDTKWNEWKLEYDSLKRLRLNKDAIVYRKDSVNFYFDICLVLLKNIYDKGILEFEEEYEYENKAPVAIEIMHDKVATELDYNSIFTLKSAYTYIIQSLNQYNYANSVNHNLEFIKRLQINKYIQPTLFYDKETSEKVKTELLDNVSITRGMVQEGERIIYKGEVVDEDKFRILESLRGEYLSTLKLSTNRSFLLVGRFILVFFAFLMIYIFMSRFRENILNSRRKTLYVLLLVVFSIFITEIVHNINFISIYIIPFALLPILINTFYDSRLALFIHFVTILLAGFYAPNSFEFIFIHFMAGLAAILGLKRIEKRGQFFSSTAITVLTYMLVYFGFAINQEGNINNIDWVNFAWFAGNGVLLLLSYPLVYISEKTFGFISDLTLMELSDTNRKLLRELAEKAPGTFQHSMQVANLAEEVIRHIGGNPGLVRTGALYHDIGKLSNPQYFTENQISGNPHDSLNFKESAKIIISHVTIGQEMAKKANLPEPIIDFILTHHGTTKTEYFYRLYKREFPNDQEAAEEFTYPGPKPYSRETAILKMADSIEAASRSLKQFTQSTINELVENIVDFQMKEKQFDTASITLAEISEAKKIFKNKLHNIYHTRIEYPEEEN